MKPAQHHISEISEYLSFHRLQTNENVSHGNVKFESPLVTCSSTTSHINCAELPGTQALANVDILSGPCEGKRCEDIFCPDLFYEMMQKKILEHRGWDNVETHNNHYQPYFMIHS